MLLLMLACAPLPEAPSQLYGTWANVDADGTVRAVEFAEAMDEPPELEGYADVYRWYNYPEGGEPALAQTGAYEIAYEHLVTTPLPNAGVSYSNALVGFHEGRWMELEVDKESGESRRYEAVDALP
ncbi:MAG: hypothetical protein H6741_09680 [Alphaproteobacteria bacterium]|nr:hypothetical protein [Alphaproteobacteria bacterium]MCB9792981.1 hypothetical protein [Alphaproteobacteria bacterium]